MINKKNKIDDLDKISKTTNIDVQRQQNKNDKIENFIVQASQQYHFNDVMRDFSTGWQNFEYEYDEDLLTAMGVAHFTLEFEKFDIRLIPFINIEPVIRKGAFAQSPDLYVYYGAGNNSYYTNKLVLIDDIKGELSEYYKKVTINVNVSINRYNETTFDYQIKFNCYFVNPLNWS